MNFPSLALGNARLGIIVPTLKFSFSSFSMYNLKCYYSKGGNVFPEYKT